MKTIRFIGIALLTVLMSVGFTACSSDSNNEEESPYNPFVGTWYGEGFFNEMDQTIHGYTFTFESNYYGTYVISKDVNENYGAPKGFTYKTRGTNELCLYYHKGQGDSLIFRYKVTPNTLSLERLTYKTLIPMNLELKKQ